MQRSWPFQVLTCEIVRGRCRSCNVDLSREEAKNTRKLFENHKRHFRSVAVVGRVASPLEYRGMDLVLTLETLLPRSRRSDGFLRIPCLIFRLSCLRCNVHVFPGGEEEVLRFRTKHESHEHKVRLEAIVQPMMGPVLRRKLEVCGWGNPSTSLEVRKLVPDAELDPLENLRRLLTCVLVGLKCTFCHVTQSFQHCADVADVVSQHQGHLSYVFLNGSIEDPLEYSGIDVNFPASPFECSSLQRELRIDCLVFEMSHGIGNGQFASLWHFTEIQRCLEKYASERNGVRLRSLVRGQWGELFELEFGLSMRSGPRPLLDFEQQWLTASLDRELDV
jgi:hypothetical protein